jgi:hypothetical protein
MTSPTTLASTRDEANARVLVDAVVYKAPVGTTAPTDLDADWPAGWDDTGWISEDGFSQTPQGDVSDLKGVTGATLKRVKSGDGWEFTFTCIESNKVTDSIIYPNRTVATASGVTTSTVRASIVPPTDAYGIDALYDDGSRDRIIVPLGSGVVTGAIQSVHTDYRKAPVSVSALQAGDGTLLLHLTDSAASAES